MTDLNTLAAKIHETAALHGFWPPEGRNMAEMLMLAVSELAEALEEHRDGNPAVWYRHEGRCPKSRRWRWRQRRCTCTPKPEGIAVELADCIIRCLDTLHSLGVDIDHVVAEKMAYNATRPFKHGKAY